jgi:hypothetical protein
MRNRTNIVNDINNNNNYEPVSQGDSDRTRDEFLEAQEKMEKLNKEKKKTNLFKSRIIDTEINASLVFQTVLYFNFYYAIMCFFLQLFSDCYKIWVFNPNNISFVRLVLLFVFLIFEMYRLHLGYQANIKEQVNISNMLYMFML